MQPINQELFKALKKSLGVGRSRLYELIQQKVAETHLDRHLAAIVLASENGIAIAKYATSEDLAMIRGALPQDSPTLPVVPVVTRARVVKTVEPLSVDLGFVSSSELKKILQRDLAELNAAYLHGVKKTPKTCMVLSGSIAEALLLDSLLQNKTAALTVAASLPKKLSSNPEDWGLYDMVTVAMKMSPPLLPADAETGANQLRRWRNLIHPGRELKDSRSKRIKPTAARARNAIAFLQFIAEELGM
jgi:hypothetical protein